MQFSGALYLTTGALLQCYLTQQHDYLVPCALQQELCQSVIYLNKVIIWAIQFSVQLNDKTLEVRRKLPFLSWAICFWGLSLKKDNHFG